MVAGLLKFKDYFKEYADSYVLIGGAACDILFTGNESEFRATRDLDMVLIVEALTPEFADIFWDFIKDGDYRHINGSNGKFYPAKGRYTVQQFQQNQIEFEPDSDYEFIRWQIYNTLTNEEITDIGGCLCNGILLRSLRFV